MRAVKKKKKKEIEDLPESHKHYSHKHFPAGKDVPCKVHSSKVVYDEETDEVYLEVMLSYGPFKTISILPKRPKIDERIRVEHIIKQKFLNCKYTVDHSYELAALFQHYKAPKVRYPDFNPSSNEEKKDFLEYFSKVFLNFFVPQGVIIYVDVEYFYFLFKGRRKEYTDLISRIKIIKND